MKNNKNINCFGIAIGAKLCIAVKRNRIKRVIRESYRNLEEKINTGNTVVFLWKKNVSIEECSYNKVLEDMKRIFEKIGIYINEECND